MRIVIPDPIDCLPQKYIDMLRDMGAKIYDNQPQNDTQIIDRIKDAEIITANYITITPKLIDASPKLKYVISPAVGFEWIDADYAPSNGIKVINCPTFVPLSVAEHAMTLIMALAKRLPEATNDLRNGIWDPNKYVGMELNGKRLGLIGYGNIGKNIEKIAHGFGLKIKYVNSKSSPTDIDSLIASSDIVCLCLPLNQKTRHMIDRRRLKLLGKFAFLINVARGAVIDQKALLESLKNKEFAGAGLDVYEGEPGADSEVSDEIIELVNLENVIGTPHSAFNTKESIDRLGAEILANIHACINGNPQNVVNLNS